MKILKKKIEDYLNLDPYNLELNIKKEKFLDIIKFQLKHHIKNCKNYRTWYQNNNLIDPNKIKNYDEISFIPSAVFKNVDLKSNKKNNKIISSSGSSGQNKSTIAIDNITSNLQKKSLWKILSSTVTKDRRTFFIADVEPLRNFGERFVSARYAGMSGYLLASKERYYLFKFNKKNELEINQSILKKLNSFLEKKPIIIIGYTYMIYDHLLKNKNFNLKNLYCNKHTKLVHFGGWKKVHDEKISKKEIKNQVINKFKIENNNI